MPKNVTISLPDDLIAMLETRRLSGLPKLPISNICAAALRSALDANSLEARLERIESILSIVVANNPTPIPAKPRV